VEQVAKEKNINENAFGVEKKVYLKMVKKWGMTVVNSSYVSNVSLGSYLV